MTEDTFEEDIEEMQNAVNNALEELTKPRAYVLKEDEIRDLKTAQYALRNLSDEFDTHDVLELYQDGA